MPDDKPYDVDAARAVCDAASKDWQLVKETVDTITQRSVPRTEEQSKADSAFIFTARTGWPEALDEIERLRKGLKKIASGMSKDMMGTTSLDREDLLEIARKTIEGNKS